MHTVGGGGVDSETVYLGCHSTEFHGNVSSSVPKADHQDALVPKTFWELVLLTVEDVAFKLMDS